LSKTIKVYDLANELGIRSIELVEKLKILGIDVKNHMSSITEEDAKKVKEKLSPKKEAKKDKKEVKTKKAPKKKIIRRKAKDIEKEKEEIKAKEELEIKKEAEKQLKAETKEAEKTKLKKSVTKKTTKEKPEDIAKKQLIEEEKLEKIIKKPVEDKKDEVLEAGRQKLKDKFKEQEKEKEKKKKTKSKKEKVEVVNFYDLNKAQNKRVRYGTKKRPPIGREKNKTLITTPKQSKRKIKMSAETISIADLAKEMSIKSAQIVKFLFSMGTALTVNDSIDYDTAIIVANNFSYEIEKAGFKEEEVIKEEEDKAKDLKARGPVVTLMGHVDHGKTSILDAIRTTKVADKEAGGITQQIGAYEVELKKGTITFVDTPGHEAFTEMRARGSQVTDIVVLVIAADDGIMPQTKESIDHARSAGVEIVVALNKVDVPNANPDRVRQQLSELDLLPEDWGGQTMVVETAAKTGDGIDKLLETILLQAEIMELKANPDRPGEGVVIEAKLDKGVGPVATVVTNRGTLKRGDYVVAGTSYGKVRAIKNSKGKMIQKIEPARSGEIQGLNDVPRAGEKFNCVENETTAKKLVQHRIDEIKVREQNKASQGVDFEELMKGVSDGKAKELKLIVKADTKGSVEALKSALINLSDDLVKVNVILANTGGVTINDVNLALASYAFIIGFNVRPDLKAQEQAKTEKLEIRFYDVIYNCLEDIEKLKKGMLEPVSVEKDNGMAEVRQTFSVPKIGTVAGCGVKSGKIIRNSMGRVLREGVVIYTGKINSLKHFKDDKKEVATGLECGLSIEGFNDIKIGDIIESFSLDKVSQEEADSGNYKKAKESVTEKS
jgi:translation initiation factor IF-2